ncbi:unnamed protein product [Echinostoma caproni]|uniref:Uncharacterized protein n=1 Tax=Echinostoma caproni TaxID=27848 RepID=A0A183AUU2_9TREM|nr:unnamed protein product [Echinostoma caproni]
MCRLRKPVLLTQSNTHFRSRPQISRWLHRSPGQHCHSSSAFQPPFDLHLLSDPDFREQTRANLLARESPLDFDTMVCAFQRIALME